MTIEQDKESFALLVSYRASLYARETGRAGKRLPNMPNPLRQWCYHTRSRRDFVLLMLDAKIRNIGFTQSELMTMLSVTRNTLKAIIDEALTWRVVEKSASDMRATDQFYQLHLESYFMEWQVMPKHSAAQLAKTFSRLAGKKTDLPKLEAIKYCLDLAVISRADSVKADRKLRLTKKQSKSAPDLSSWVGMHAFNRDLLILIMDATIRKRPKSIAFLTSTLRASRNSVKDSLRLGMAGGFLEKTPSGYCATEGALDAYLQWHIDAFSMYSSEYLAAMAYFHDKLHSFEPSLLATTKS